ncbi:MAG: bifunctional diguanylate cyclase/phosphodiesterase [Lachnospiraceae bacterium]|nr:bifunctional diguanylate cyclase/phosphodiesterase [Lachnospiraceae bacterium]
MVRQSERQMPGRWQRRNGQINKAYDIANRTARMYENGLVVWFDCIEEKFFYPDTITETFPGEFDDRPLWEIFERGGLCSEVAAKQIQARIKEACDATEPNALYEEYFIKNAGEEWKWYCVGFVTYGFGNMVTITFTDINDEIISNQRFKQRAENDELTGLLNRNAFCRKVDSIVQKNPEDMTAGKYAVVYFDVLRFKAINDMFGMAEGDRVLCYVADLIVRLIGERDLACRIDSDRFIFFTNTYGEELEKLIDKLLEGLSAYNLPFAIACNVGVYVTVDDQVSAVAMMDRAILAQSKIKGSYTVKCNYYTEEMRNDLLSEQEISGIMEGALADKHFVVYYQPQYNHATGGLVGAEALVRWKHPERGLISPGLFIPIFERNGFITKLDLYVFEQVCCFLRNCIDKGITVIPISSNFSQYDIFQPRFVEKLEELRTKYDVPVKYLRVEITESAIVGGSERVNEIVKRLRECGYVVEMDDFGSGYSSLNVLREVDLDVIKLDMLFLSEKANNNRGGTIISSIVRMAKWLDMPVIAEGVETMGQADFLRSIGCEFIQGYLYSKPLPEEEFESLLEKSQLDMAAMKEKQEETISAHDFWEPKSQETLIFSNFVGGAAIFEYHNGKAEILRVNKKYLKELGMNLSEKDLIETDPFIFFDEENGKIYSEALKKAVETGEEQECDTWRKFSSSCCGDERICIRSNVRLIGHSGNHYLFYSMIRNVTTEKEYYQALMDNERRFKFASEQANIYFWEYTVATREMRPCFRCMRDLGLPALLTNYPDSAIEMGVFPPEVADMYRDWHRQIAEGVPELEAVMPLTVGRVPFRVKYTTEFDENGRPVKAYGSATLIVDGE